MMKLQFHRKNLIYIASGSSFALHPLLTYVFIFSVQVANNPHGKNSGTIPQSEGEDTRDPLYEIGFILHRRGV